jgi:hypothetical protein
MRKIVRIWQNNHAQYLTDQCCFCPLLLLLLLAAVSCLVLMQIGFLIKPFGFFESNPALDVPPEDTKHSGSGACATASNSSGSCCAAGAGPAGVQVVTSNIRSKL